MFVFSNLATSLDGKIATASREYFALGSARDRRLMSELRKRSDVVVFGASSLRTFKRPCIVYGPTARGLGKQPANAVLSSALEGISPRWPFFTHKGFHRILFVGPEAPASRLKLFERTCEIIRLRNPGQRHSTAKQVIQALEARGYGKILVEGGGSVMWDFVAGDWIDEYYVTLTPRILGGAQAPTLVDGTGFKPSESLGLKLTKLRRAGDELFLVYRRKPTSTA